MNIFELQDYLLGRENHFRKQSEDAATRFCESKDEADRLAYKFYSGKESAYQDAREKMNHGFFK